MQLLAYTGCFNSRALGQEEDPSPDDDIIEMPADSLDILSPESVPLYDQEVFFDGKDREGRSLASGVYFARIETTDGNYRKRVAIVK